MQSGRPACGLAGAALAGGGAAAGAGAVAAGAGLTAMIAAGVSAGLVGAFAGNQIAGALGLLKDGKLEEKTAAAANSLADPSADLFTNIDKQLALVDELKREVQHHEDRSASWGLRTLEMIAGTVGLVETTATNSLQDASVRYSEASRTLTKLQQEADANRNKLLRIDTGQGKMAGIESDAAADDKRIAKRDAWIASTKHAFSTLGGLAGDAINATGEAWAKHMKSLEESARMIAKDMASQGLALTKSLRTPLEQFETKIAKAGELLAAGAISPEIFDRAIKDAQDALDRSRSTSGANQPGSIQTAIGTYKFAGANRSQQTIAASSASTAASSAAIAVSSAASAKAPFEIHSKSQKIQTTWQRQSSCTMDDLPLAFQCLAKRTRSLGGLARMFLRTTPTRTTRTSCRSSQSTAKRCQPLAPLTSHRYRCSRNSST